jgi:hypothetical protein
MPEEHDSKVYEPKYEQLPSRRNYSWPHICLARETHESHERKAEQEGDQKVFYRSSSEIFRVFRGQKNNRNEKQIATIAANQLIIVAAPSARSAT